MNIYPLMRMMGNIPLLISGILHSTPLKKFRPRNLEIIYNHRNYNLPPLVFVIQYLIKLTPKSFEAYFPYQYM
jgi:hypothetical protein